MATERLSMRNTREILRQKWTLGRSHREVGHSVAVSIGAVSAVIARAIAAGLDWPAVQALTDEALESKLYPSVAAASERAMPDCAYIHVELRAPAHADHRFRRKPISDSGPSRSPIPEQADR
jgi:hypothetical protein